MARYIDADPIMEDLRIVKPITETEAVAFRFAYCKLKDAPTADVVERKHGRWLPYEFGTKRWHKCSVCGKADEYINERGIEAVRKFCPNCGAEMRE